MSRGIFTIACIATCLLNLGCSLDNDDDWIVDWSPVYIYINATDAEGNGIIQPDMPGMSLTYKGEIYTVQDWEQMYQRTSSKAYLARLYGLFAQPGSAYASAESPYRLIFGEIDGALDMDEDIILNWPDGTIDIIHYHCSNHKSGKNASCNRSWKLNGKNHNGSEFGFIKSF